MKQSTQHPAYQDTPTDLAFIALCRLAYGKLAGWQSPRPWSEGHETYAGMVEVSRALMRRFPSPADQRAAVIRGFPEVPDWFRKVFPYSKWGAELNARITPAFFTWLVGPMEVVEVTADDGRAQHSGVHIKQCRYLAESGCVGMCVNLCQQPVQTFFTQQLGMPLTMEPNFEDMSCRCEAVDNCISFQVPPGQDVIWGDPCAIGRGPSGAAPLPCCLSHVGQRQCLGELLPKSTLILY